MLPQFFSPGHAIASRLGVPTAARGPVIAAPAGHVPPQRIAVPDPPRRTPAPLPFLHRGAVPAAPSMVRPSSATRLTGPPMLRPNEIDGPLASSRAHARQVQGHRFEAVEPQSAPRVLAPNRVRGVSGPSSSGVRRTRSVQAASGTGINPWWRYQEEGIPGGGRVMVNVGTGNVLLQDDDMAVPHKGIALTFRRTYNSQSLHTVTAGLEDGFGWSPPGLYGNGWTNTFDAHVVAISDTQESVFDVDGARYDYVLSSNPAAWVAGMTGTPATPGDHSSLVFDGACGWLWTKKSGTTYYFYTNNPGRYCPALGTLGAYSGRLRQIIGRNRNTYLTFSYSWDNGDASAATGKISAISAQTESGMTATLTFANIGGHRLLEHITFPDGATTVAYGYDAQGNLNNVSRPANNAFWDRPSHGYGYVNQGTGGSIIGWADSPRWAKGGGEGNVTSFAFTGISPATATLSMMSHYANVNPAIPDGTNTALQSGPSTAAYEYYDAYYVTGGSPSTFRDSDGHATNWLIDSRGRPTQTQECTATTSGSCTGTWLVSNETWDVDNNLAVEVDPRGNETDYLYDLMGNTTAVGEPYTSTSQGSFKPTRLFDYDTFNNVVAYCDQSETHAMNGDWTPATTSIWANDSLCAMHTNVVPHWSATYSYPSQQPYGELTSMTTPLGYTHTIAYDASKQGGNDFGLPTSVTGAPFAQLDGSTTAPVQTFWYDAPGNLRCHSKGQGTAVLSYDVLGRTTSVADPDDSSANGTSLCGKTTGRAGWNTQTTYVYNSDGTVQSSQTPAERAAGVSTSFAYDVDGNTTSETRHFGWNNGPVPAGVTTKWYDGADRLVEVAQPQDPADAKYAAAPWRTRYSYDLSMGQSVSMPQAGATYRAYGHLYKTQEWSSGGWIDLKGQAFDAMDRSTRTYSFVPGSNATRVNVTSMSYDSSPATFGFLSSKTDGIGAVTNYAYNERGASSAVTYVNDGGVTPPRSYTYDADGHVTSVANAGYGTKVYRYDLGGRLSEVDEPTSGSVSYPAQIGYDYYPDGSRKDVTVVSALLNANPLLRYSYQSDGLPSNTAMTYGGTVYAFQSSYTAAGRITSRTDPFTGTATPSGTSGTVYTPMTWGYDTAGQLATLMMPYAFGYTAITHDPEGHVVGWRSSVGLNNDIVAGFTNTVRGENIKQVQTPTNPNWHWPPLKPWNANPAHGAIVPVMLREALETPSIDRYNAIVTGWSGTASVQTDDGLYRSCPNSSTDNYDSASRLSSRYVVGDLRCSGYSGTSDAWSYDADNHTTGNLTNTSYALCGIVWGPDGNAIKNPCSGGQTYPTGASETLHYDGADILFVTNSQGLLTDIRVGTLGDLSALRIARSCGYRTAISQASVQRHTATSATTGSHSARTANGTRALVATMSSRPSTRNLGSPVGGRHRSPTSFWRSTRSAMALWAVRCRPALRIHRMLKAISMASIGRQTSRCRACAPRTTRRALGPPRMRTPATSTTRPARSRSCGTGTTRTHIAIQVDSNGVLHWSIRRSNS
jgi:YD repeat-containing protein